MKKVFALLLVLVVASGCKSHSELWLEGKDTSFNVREAWKY